MQTIITKYLGSTNTRPARIKATTTSGISITVSRDSDIACIVDDYKRVARLLIDKLNWPWRGRTIGGSLRGGGYVWVCDDKNNPAQL